MDPLRESKNHLRHPYSANTDQKLWQGPILCHCKVRSLFAQLLLQKLYNHIFYHQMYDSFIKGGNSRVLWGKAQQ